MNTKRLLKLADLLEQDAKNRKGIKFDLALWGKTTTAGDYDTPALIPVDCQTTACAVGLACVSGAFKRAGLTYQVQNRIDGGGNNIIPVFGDDDGFEAVEMFFGIDDNEATFLFEFSSYPERKRTGRIGERTVAKRIRDFVAGKVAPEPIW